MWDVVRILKYSFHLVAGLVFWSLNFKIEERDCSFSQMCRTCNAQQKSRLCHNNVSKSGVLEIMCSAQFIVQASMQWAFTVKWMMSRIHAFLGRIWIKTPLKEFCKTQTARAYDQSTIMAISHQLQCTSKSPVFDGSKKC